MQSECLVAQMRSWKSEMSPLISLPERDKLWANRWSWMEQCRARVLFFTDISAACRWKPRANLHLPSHAARRHPSVTSLRSVPPLGVRWCHTVRKSKRRSRVDSKVEQVLKEIEVFPRSQLDQHEIRFSVFF